MGEESHAAKRNVIIKLDSQISDYEKNLQFRPFILSADVRIDDQLNRLQS